MKWSTCKYFFFIETRNNRYFLKLIHFANLTHNFNEILKKNCNNFADSYLFCSNFCFPTMIGWNPSCGNEVVAVSTLLSFIVQVFTDANLPRVSQYSCDKLCWGAKRGVAIHGKRHGNGFSTVILAKQYIFLSILFSKKVKSFLFKKGISKMSTLAIDFTLLISTGVTAFYVVLYVNFGAILDWQKIKIIVKKPIEPCLGFFCNFIFLPLVRKSKFWNWKIFW